MASIKISRSWDKPLCLIETVDDGQLRVNDLTCSLLSQVPAPIVVVGIAGLYRTGKSYLLNLLAGKTKGFSLGSTIQSCTRGIWVWCVEHPGNPGWTLLLMDTEGLGDPEKGDRNHDIWIFALAVLLSSTLVYNSKGTIDNDALEKLYFVTEIADHIKIKSAGEDEEVDFDKVFPSFAWAVRDFMLDLTLDGRSITADEYLETALHLRRGAGKKVQNHNLPRECIRSYFRSRTCFTFPTPVTERELMRDLETVKEEQLSPAFVEASQSFREYIYTRSTPKMVKGSRVAGGMLAGLAKTYVEAIMKGAVPCVESAIEVTAKLENTRAVEEAVAFYRDRMESIPLPTESVADVSAVHQKCYAEAVAIFMEKAIFDNDHIYQNNLMQTLNDLYAKICQENEQASVNKCCALLAELSKELNDNVAAGVYMVPGGYQAYQKHLMTVAQQYNGSPGKGIKGAETLHQFLESKKTEGGSILAADEKITEEQKKKEEQRQRAEANDRERKIAEENRKKTEQEMADREKSFNENVRQLQEKMAEEIKDMRKEHEEVVASRLEEQQQLLNEGFKERAKEMQKDIDSLRKEQEKAEKEANKKGVWESITSFLSPIGAIASIAAPLASLFSRSSKK